MIVEYVRYELPAERRAAFEAAYAQVGPVLTDSPHCLGWELRRCVEEPGHYVVRIEWDSQSGHEDGFRRSPQFEAFFAALRPFAAGRRQMAHFELLHASAGRSAGTDG